MLLMSYLSNKYDLISFPSYYIFYDYIDELIQVTILVQILLLSLKYVCKYYPNTKREIIELVQVLKF